MDSRICIFGDSIVWGASDKNCGGWADQLKLLVMEKSEGENQVYPLGICGDDTRGLLRRFEAEADARHPDLIIFSIGTNDSSFTGINGKERVGEKEFEKNIEELIMKSKKYTEKIIFCGLLSVDEKQINPAVMERFMPYSNDQNKKYDKIIRNICLKNRLLYIHMADILGEDDFEEDGLHPNACGHKKIFEKVKLEFLNNKLI